MINKFLLSDSYKYSHFNQFPEDTSGLFYYFASRGGAYPQIRLSMLQYYIDNYLRPLVTLENYDELMHAAAGHGIPVNNLGFHALMRYIQDNRKWPVEIYSVPENTDIPHNVALFTVESLGEFAWVAGWLETLLSKVWYPSTIATRCHAIKTMLKEYYERYSDSIAGVDYAYHNFGDRGSSSVESALIGGLAHLHYFKGTDNFNAAARWIEEGGVAVSIPASEHSTVTSWGQTYEYKMYKNYLETYKDKPMIACVLDSYNIYEAVDYCTKALKPFIESDDYPMFVMRPDSGNPEKVLQVLLHIMNTNKVSFKTNTKGMKVWNKYRLIWGDGVNQESMQKMLNIIVEAGYSPENIAFGSGGDLMQNITRDTCKFAMKCSAIKRGDRWQDVYKNPIDAPDKKSLAGKLVTVTETVAGRPVDVIKTIRQDAFDPEIHTTIMQKVY